MRGVHFHDHEELPDGVLVSVQGVSKAPPLPLPSPPKWLAKVLPGAQWSARSERRDDTEEDVDDEDEDMDDYDPDERLGVAFKELSFDVSAGEGLGLVGPDHHATQMILFIITGFHPPSTGQILIRGRVAPLLKPAALNIASQLGKKAIDVTGKYLGWPPDLTRGAKWDQIVQFARIDELTEYPKGSIEYDQLVTRRLIQSAALLLDDATVYLVGHSFARDPGFSERCYQVLEQRQREGCAIVQNGVEVEAVSRLCPEAIYVEAGTPMFRGRLGEVAKFALERPKDLGEGAIAVPVRALLLGEGVEIGNKGGKIEIELDVFKADLELDLAMLFTDELGHETRLEQPESFAPSEPGIYRLTIDVPGGLLGYSSYSAKLLATGVNGAATEHTLLSFDFMSHSFGSGPATEEDEPDFDGVIDEDQDDDEVVARDAEWNVQRAGS